MWMQLLPSLSQALATFAGAVFVLVGIWYRDQLETRSKARNAKVQIVAEVQAILDLIELNGYLPILKETIADLRAGGSRHFYFPSGRSFTAVYEANLQNLGLLDQSASDVVRFYMIITSAVEDKDTVNGIALQLKALEDQGHPVDPALRSRMIRFHEMIFGKFSTAVHIGEKLCEELRLENPVRGKVRKRNRAATIVELDDIQNTPDSTLVAKHRAETARAHQPVQH